jgi:NAD(P)H-flavin reductase
MFVLQCGIVLYRNGIFRHGYSRACITHTHGAVKICIHLQRPLKVETGQYINLWIPSVSFWSFVQSHPFVVTSWAPGRRNTLDLFIEPRRGLTHELLKHAKNDNVARSHLVLFSGPHGISVDMGMYEKIVIVANGFGIGAHLPYLRRLIHGHSSREFRIRRIHLVWQIQDIGKLKPVI